MQYHKYRFLTSVSHKKEEVFLCEPFVSVVLLNLMCSPTARKWGVVRANIYQTWALNNPHL